MGPSGKPPVTPCGPGGRSGCGVGSVLTSRAALDAFRSGAPAETEAAAYLRNLAIEDAVYRSHDERRWIDV